MLWERNGGYFALLYTYMDICAWLEIVVSFAKREVSAFVSHDDTNWGGLVGERLLIELHLQFNRIAGLSLLRARTS